MKAKTRNKRRKSALRPKEQWLQATGGLRIGEPESLFKMRVVEINKLEKRLRSGRLLGDEPERILRRLCQLKGIYFDSYDPPDD
jgi:hypothetical protein